MTLENITWSRGVRLPHDPNASDIYRWNWAHQLGWRYDAEGNVLVPGETILSQVIEAEAGITAALVTVGSTYVDIRISGGTVNKTYAVTNRITSTPNGRIQDRTIRFSVRER